MQVEDLTLLAALRYFNVTMTRADFLSDLGRLEGQLKQTIPSVGCISSTDMHASSRCMFSKDLDNCYRCTHCQSCANSTSLTHSSGCEACHASAYLQNSKYCTGGAYLIHCTACTDCTYCVGCVGLTKKDFHILNVPYSRTEYFKALNQLKRELGIR